MRICPHCQEEIYDLQNPEYNHEPLGDRIGIWVTGTCRNCNSPLRIYATGDVEAGEMPSQDELIDEAASKAIDKMQNPGQVSKRLASQWALEQIKEEYPWFEPETAESGEPSDLVFERIDEQTPDEWEGEIEYSEDRGYYLKNVTACPNCGNDSIFNIVAQHNIQMVQKAGTEHQFVPDDISAPHMPTASCGKCFEELSTKSSS